MFNLFKNSHSSSRQLRRYDSPQFKRRIQDARNQQRLNKRQLSSGNQSVFDFTRLKIRILLFLLAGGVIAGFYYLILSDYFVVKNLSISGNHKFTLEEAENILRDDGNKRHFLVKKTNLLVISKNSLLKLFSSRTPYVKEIVSIKRSWPDTIFLEITERSPEFLLKSGGSYYLIDSEGLVVEKTSQQIGDYYMVENLIEEQFELLELFPNQKLSGFIISTGRTWSNKINTPIKSIKIPGKASSEAHYETMEGWTVLFDVSNPVSQQLSALNLLLQRQINQAQRKNLVYIDLRSAKYAYICYKNSACDKTTQVIEGENVDVQK